MPQRLSRPSEGTGSQHHFCYALSSEANHFQQERGLTLPLEEGYGTVRTYDSSLGVTIVQCYGMYNLELLL